MGGGLLQLVAYGAQDAYLIGNPHITFWKVMYKRHTNFAIEAFRVNFTGAPMYGQRLVAVINRNADLMYRTYVEVTLPDTTLGSSPDVLWTAGASRRLGYLLLQQMEVEIGGQVIDKQFGEWLYLWENLTASFNESVKLDEMVGGRLSGAASSMYTCGGRPGVLYIPLQFWFCRNPGLALPLIALQYHEVRINITLRDATDLVNATNYGTISKAAGALPQVKDMALYVDYVYLDTDERRRFAQDSHEYLIDQLQFSQQQSITTSSGRIDLTLNHPVKELIWVFQDERKLDCSDPFATGYTQPFSYDDIVNRCRLQINGQDRFEERFGDYFWKVQPYQHHTGGAFWKFIGAPTSAAGSLSYLDGLATSGGGATAVTRTTALATDGRIVGLNATNPINVYSFALKPEEHQPSGTCNFSRIDTATLVYDSIRPKDESDTRALPTKNTPFAFRLYAVSYNILRIMSGMGGLAYSN